MKSDHYNELIENLYEKYYEPIFERCYYYVHRQSMYYELVEDCVQNAFVKAIVNYEKIKDYNNPAGWISNAAYNNLRSEMQKLRRRMKVASSCTELEAEDTTFSIESRIEQREIAEKLVDIFDKLTEQEKTVFFPYFLEDLSLKETARKTELSINSVRAAIGRIRKRARRLRFDEFVIIIGCYLGMWHTK